MVGTGRCIFGTRKTDSLDFAVVVLVWWGFRTNGRSGWCWRIGEDLKKQGIGVGDMAWQVSALWTCELRNVGDMVTQSELAHVGWEVRESCGQRVRIGFVVSRNAASHCCTNARNKSNWNWDTVAVSLGQKSHARASPSQLGGVG